MHCRKDGPKPNIMDLWPLKNKPSFLEIFLKNRYYEAAEVFQTPFNVYLFYPFIPEKSEKDPLFFNGSNDPPDWVQGPSLYFPIILTSLSNIIFRA